MIKHYRMLAAFTTLFSLTPALSQTCTTPSATASGTDNAEVTVSVTDFSCATGVADAYITGITINTEIGNNCPNWYYHSIVVDGTEYSSNSCEGAHDLGDYIYDFNSVNNISIASADNPSDGFGDNVNMSIDADLTYIITNCPPPGDFVATDIGTSTVDLDWNPNGSESFWQIEVVNLTAGDTATGVGTNLGIVTDSTTLTGLLPETEYAVYIRANCLTGTDVTSLWLGPLTFTTYPTCYPITSSDIMDITDVEATAFWPTIEDGWEIELVDITAGNSYVGNPTTLALTDTFYNFTGLTPDNQYSYKVRANCGIVDGNGAWSPATAFTTDPTCVQPSNIVLNSISSSDMSISWTSNDTETSWAIDLVNVDSSESFTGTADYISSDTVYVISGLNPNSTYNVYVSAICSATDTSSWTEMGENTTLCLPFTVPYVDSLNTWISDCYSISNTSSSGQNWSTYGSDGMIRSNISQWSTGQTRFTTGSFDMDTLSVLSFDWSSRGQNASNNWLSVEYTIDNGTNWIELWKKVGNDLESNDGAQSWAPGSYVTATSLLPTSTVDELVKFRFTFNHDFWQNRVFLDIIKVEPISDCNVAFDLQLDTVTAGVATFSFTDIAGDESSSWDYTISSDGPDVTGSTTTNPFDVSGLTPGTVYSISMNTICTSDTSDASGAVSFTLPCAPLTNYFEGFEAYQSNDDPNCWLEITTSTGGTPNVAVNTSPWNGGGFNSTNSLRLSASWSHNQQADIIAITPELLDLSTSWLQFRHLTNEPDATSIIVGSMTDYADGSTFVGLDTIDLTQNNWELYTFIPNEHPTFTGNRIAIKANFSLSWDDLVIDNVLYEKIPDCYYPELVVDSTNLTGFYGTLDAFNSTDAIWELEIVNLTTGETFTGTPTDTVNTTVFYLDGLESSTTYNVYIRTFCDSTSSLWADPITFSTTCAPVTEFSQGWEAGSTCWTHTAEGSNTNIINDLVTWANPLNGSLHNRLSNSNSNPSATEVYTATPELSNLSDGTHWLTFNAKKPFIWSSNTIVEVGTMSDPEDPSTFSSLQSFTLTGSYQLFEYSFVSYTGTDEYIALRLDPTIGSWKTAYLDDIVWEEAPECATPGYLSTDSITDISALVDWNPISADSAWHMEIVNISAGDSFTGVATDSTVSHPYLFDGLSQNTIYGVKVRAICDTNWSDEVLFTTLTSYDIEVSNFVNLGPNGCMLTTQEEAIVTITNYGAQTATNFDVYYSQDGITYTNDGTFTGLLLPGEDTAYALSYLFDFSTADTTLYIATSLVGDTIFMDNDSNSTNVINNGNAEIDLAVNTGQWAYENSWFVIDTATETTVGTFDYGFGTDFQSFNYKVCVNVGTTYSMEAWDTFGDGWNGGVYAITQCSGVLVANNNGESPTTDPAVSGLQSQEYFTIEECDDYDLGIISMDSLESDCGLSSSEQAYLSVKNFGLFDIIPSYNVSVEYQVNNSGWTTLASISNLVAGGDTLLALPTVNMVTPLSYTFDFNVVYADDENSDNDTLYAEIESVDTYTDVDQDFEDAKSGWTPHIATGTLHSWEWGVPTTPTIAATADGKAWVTNLDQNMTLNEESYLLSPCFDLSGYTEDAEVSFDFIWTVPQFAGHSVRFHTSIDGGSTWSTALTLPRNTTEWTNENMLLSSVSGESDVKFRFFIDNTFNSPAEGFGMDNFKVIEHVAYTDTTLVDLTVDGVTIAGFDPSIFDYDYVVPFGVTTVPTVDAEENAPYITSLTVTQAPTTTGSATVVVVAEDTNYMATYTVNFSEGAADSVALLSELKIDGLPVAGFDSLIFTYNHVLPFGTTIVPTVTNTTVEATATATTVNATALPGSTVVTVVAQNGVTTNDYTINFSVEAGDSVSTLSELRVDGNLVTGFHSDTLEYTETVGGSTADITYITTSTNAIVTMSSPNPQTVPSTVMVTVMAQDSSETVYTVHLQNAQSSNAYLVELNYEDGPGSWISVPGFDSLQFVYNITLPFGSSVPDVEGIVSDTNSSVGIIHATTISGSTIVKVTAQDGTVITYTINWSVIAASSDNLLASMSISYGLLVQEWDQVSPFDQMVNEYTLFVDDALLANPAPTVSAVPQDANATIGAITTPASIPGTYFIPCIAQNGDTNMYVIKGELNIGQEELEAGTVSIFPNPSTGIFNVQVKDNVANFGIEVINPIGQSVYSSEFVNDNANVKVDLSTYANGLYHVVVKDINSGLSTIEKVSILK